MMTGADNDFAAFLILAKKATYASQGDDASVTPALAGSRQLEFRDRDLFYRDVYFGTVFFAGQETVYVKGRAQWTMVYSGGVKDGVDADEIPNIYMFLREALRAVSTDMPFRGPCRYSDGEFTYHNNHSGDMGRFHGTERISRMEHEVYALDYSGGFLQ